MNLRFSSTLFTPLIHCYSTHKCLKWTLLDFHFKSTFDSPFSPTLVPLKFHNLGQIWFSSNNLLVFFVPFVRDPHFTAVRTIISCQIYSSFIHTIANKLPIIGSPKSSVFSGDLSSTESAEPDQPLLSATTANVTDTPMSPLVLSLIGQMSGGLVKMYIGGGLLALGFCLLIGCLVMFCCCVRPQLLAAAEGGRSLQYNVVTLPGGGIDSKASSM